MNANAVANLMWSVKDSHVGHQRRQPRLLRPSGTRCSDVGDRNAPQVCVSSISTAKCSVEPTPINPLLGDLAKALATTVTTTVVSAAGTRVRQALAGTEQQQGLQRASEAGLLALLVCSAPTLKGDFIITTFCTYKPLPLRAIPARMVW